MRHDLYEIDRKRNLLLEMFPVNFVLKKPKDENIKVYILKDSLKSSYH